MVFGAMVGGVIGVVGLALLFSILSSYSMPAILLLVAPFGAITAWLLYPLYTSMFYRWEVARELGSE